MTSLARSTFAAATRSRTRVVCLAIVIVGVGLTIAYFPALFDHWFANDDEGYLLITMRGFLKRGSLYHDTFTQYGPFYYLLIAPLYWITGKDPTLDSGRLVVLLFTTTSASLFAAAVWRVSKSLPWTIFCQVGTFLLLIAVNPAEPMHPGSLIALLLAVLTLALATYATSSGSWALGIAGASVGALTMTKVNVGVLAMAGLALAFGIGNQTLGRRTQLGLVAIVALSPFVIVHDNLSQSWAISLAALVAIGVVTLCAVSLSRDDVTLPRDKLLAVAAGFLGVVLVCLVFLLATGTPLGSIIDGIVIEPLKFARRFFIAPTDPMFKWGIVLATLAGIAFVLVMRGARDRNADRPAWSWPDAVLAGGALWLFGIGVGRFGSFASWLLPLTLLPALAISANAAPAVKLALRLLVPLAVLQVLHAYPVAGSQQAWATVAMAVPCAIAIAAGTDRLALWSELTAFARASVIAALSIVLMLGLSLGPIGIWKRYLNNPPLDLPGSSLLRIDAAQGQELRHVTQTVRDRCDVLWFSPWGFGSFYVFTGFEPPTGLFSGIPAGLMDRDEQQRVIRALKASERGGKRLCILTDTTPVVGQTPGTDTSLGEFTAKFTSLLEKVGRYAIYTRE
jgi:hypothetical protein